MDRKYSNLKLIGSAMLLLATAVGTYFLYVYSREKKQRSERKKDEENIPRLIFQKQREIANNLRKKGNAFFNQRQFDNALDCYNEALRICPLQFHQDTAKLHQNKSAALHNLDRIDEALVDANKALDLSPRYKTALIRRSKIHEAQGRFQQALFDTAAAVIFDSSDRSDSINRMDHISKIIATHAVEEQLMMDPILQSESNIRNYFLSFPNDPLLQEPEDHEQSEESEQPIVPDCFNLLRMGKYQESFQAVQDALLNSDWSEEIMSRLYLLRATFYVLCCREALALDDFAKVIRNRDATPQVKVNAIIKQATVLLLHDSALDIEEAFGDALQMDPGCPDIYYHRGLSFEIAQDRLAAIRDYQRAVDLYPEYSFAAVHNVFNKYLLSEDSHPTTYLDEFSALINRFPKCIESHMIYAKVLMGERKTEEAERISDSLRLLQPDSGLILSLIANIKVSQKKVWEAVEILTEAIEKDPKHAELYHCLAAIYIRKGDLEDAIEHLDRAIVYARNRKTMRDYIELREGLLAQLNVSNTFDISVKDVLKEMSQGAILSPDDM